MEKEKRWLLPADICVLELEIVVKRELQANSPSYSSGSFIEPCGWLSGTGRSAEEQGQHLV
ncbi:MAG: hypothetical protein ACP5PV_03475 [Methanothrix sp.]